MNVLDAATTTANALEKAADSAEQVLTDTCQAAELAIVETSATDAEAATRIAVVHSKCALAWDRFNDFKQTWLELSYSLDAARATAEDPNVQNVVDLLAKLVKEEHDFAAMVTQILHDYGKAN